MKTTDPYEGVLTERMFTELVARADRIVQIAEDMTRDHEARKARPVLVPQRRIRGLVLELHGFAARLDDLLRRLDGER